MGELSGVETAVAADKIINQVGSKWMLSPEMAEHGKEQGFGNQYAFYAAGRGGALGDVDAEVVAAAFGWFELELIRVLWDEGVAVAGAREASRRWAQAFAAWGDDNVPADERLCELAGRVVQAAHGAGLPLFSGWRAAPLPATAPGQIVHLLHVLRELRGELHIAAATAMGLSPLETILTSGGEEQAKRFGWQGGFPDCAELKPRRAEAEELTDRLAGAVYERALTPAERAEFADRVGKVGAALLD